MEEKCLRHLLVVDWLLPNECPVSAGELSGGIVLFSLHRFIELQTEERGKKAQRH